ncbi:CoA-binding protein [Sphingomonas panacis]|uniref:CoA-binding protein n=1 Tax=Sphingomonas panacis TaxID=1560345 RepID=A0A1B3Z6V8_9SPHN|nr:bifunctional acetate--CoA ligase family protein/GNAT family N-acetyltransferase [Sphingomonas panacis]AOH83155.1 CoA-binding protein [Sphingomonas panacis]
MTIRNLSPLLRPTSVALIGASARAGAIGAVVLETMRSAGFAGTIYAVNPHPVTQDGAVWVPSIAALGSAPDLAIIMTPAPTVPDIIAELGRIGTRCAVVISAGITEANGLRQKMLDAAKPHGLRIVGPNCLGIVAPHARLNATFARSPATPGRLAFISQSGALVTAMLGWAQTRDIGFSGIVSAGDMADVDLGDLIDLFAVDPHTDAILMYVEGVTDAAKFMAAARAAARIKPVIAIKAGRSPEAAKATLSHTGALAGSYEVYRAAFDRAGIVTVETLSELFDAAEILTAGPAGAGERLGIVTNGGGAGILAVDALPDAGASLATLSSETIATLDGALPEGWSRSNPVDVIGDAGPERYRVAVKALLADPAVDALLIMNCPTAQNDAAAIAAVIADEVAGARAKAIDKPVLVSWLGDMNTKPVRDAMNRARIPAYATPDDAVRGFGYLLAAARARHALTDAPAATRETTVDIAAARHVIAEVRGAKRTVLNEVEAKALLDAFGIPTVPTRLARSVGEVGEMCGFLTPPFAVKVVSPELSHKSDVGGVALDLHDRKAAEAAAAAMETRITREHPEAWIEGYSVQEMVVRPHAHELIAGIATDPTFGPLVMVGAGGTGVQIIDDTALDLVPIDHAQAHALIGRTRISKLLAGYRNVPAADTDAVAGVLDALSALCVALPDVIELDINPLIVDQHGVIALDARVRITASADTQPHLAIAPTPLHWAAELETRSGLHIFVRPVRADDEALLAEFFEHVTPEDLRFRFLSSVDHVGHDRLAMMTRVDYRRTISFLAFDQTRTSVIATAMLATDPDRTHAEVALVTRADMKGRGVSWSLFAHVLRYARAERIGTVEAIECADHEAAIRMEREMGFVAEADADDPSMRIVRRLFSMEEAV